MSVCHRRHTADRTQPYTPSDARKPPWRLRCSKHGPLPCVLVQPRPTDKFFWQQEKRIRNTLTQHTVARTRKVRRVPANQPVRASRSGDCAPQKLACISISLSRTDQQNLRQFGRLRAENRWKLRGVTLNRQKKDWFTPKPTPGSRGDPLNEWARRAHRWGTGGSLYH